MSRDHTCSLIGAIARLSRDARGASAALVAIALPALIGFGALGTEAGLWYTLKLRNQSAADAAAMSAAYEVLAGKTNVASDLTLAASEAAAQNGYVGTPAVAYPYSDSIVSDGIAVTLQHTQQALLASMFLSDVTVSAKAVAVIEVLDNPCILALATSGTGVEVDDFSRLETANCSVAANSTSMSAIDLHSNTSSIAAETLVTAGEVSFQGSPINPAAPPSEFILTLQPMIGAPSIADPYAGTLTHSFLTTGMPTARCAPKTQGTVTTYNTANCVIAGLIIKTGHTVYLSHGTYWITGSLTLQPSSVLKCPTCDNAGGTGVTIIVIAHNNKIGYVSMTNAMFNLNAPNSGRFAGIVMVQDANGLPPGTTYIRSYSTVAGGPSATLNGLVYFPKSSMTFQGNPSATGPKCLLLVVSTLAANGTSSLETSECASAGLTQLPTVYTVALAE